MRLKIIDSGLGNVANATLFGLNVDSNLYIENMLISSFAPESNLEYSIVVQRCRINQLLGKQMARSVNSWCVMLVLAALENFSRLRDTKSRDSTHDCYVLLSCFPWVRVRNLKGFPKREECNQKMPGKCIDITGFCTSREYSTIFQTRDKSITAGDDVPVQPLLVLTETFQNVPVVVQMDDVCNTNVVIPRLVDRNWNYLEP